MSSNKERQESFKHPYPFRVITIMEGISISDMQLVNSSANGALDHAVDTKSLEIQGRVKERQDARGEINKVKHGGRRRKAREISDIRNQIDTEINALERRLQIVRGEALGVINVVKDGGRVVDIQAREFHPWEASWWHFVVSDQKLRQMSKKNPKNFSLLQKACILRHQSLMDTSKQSEYWDIIDSIKPGGVVDHYLVIFSQSLKVS